ncbi:MAG: sialidase family protein [Promethearchaeota archaeon]
MKKKKIIKILKYIIIVSIVLGGIFIGGFFLRHIFSRYDKDLNYISDVFKAGDEGYFCFRIPAILSLPGNIVLAFAEGRVNSVSDFGNIDIVMKRSEDGGKTWSDLVVLFDGGDLAVQNPTPVYDPTTEKVLLPVTLDRHRMFILESADKGETWTTPREITNVKLPEWEWCVNGPGHGIVLSSGRILLPSTHYMNGVWNSHFVYSDDHGQNWTIGHIFNEKTNECLSVELINGSIYTILRKNNKEPNANYKLVAISSDQGESVDTIYMHKDLNDPICQASIIRFTTTSNSDKNRLLFSNPNSKYRENLSIKLSEDEGKSWPIVKTVFSGWAGYSDLCILDDKSVCCIFENGRLDYRQKITLVNFDLNWLYSSN